MDSNQLLISLWNRLSLWTNKCWFHSKVSFSITQYFIELTFKIQKLLWRTVYSNLFSLPHKIFSSWSHQNNNIYCKIFTDPIFQNKNWFEIKILYDLILFIKLVRSIWNEKPHAPINNNLWQIIFSITVVNSAMQISKYFPDQKNVFMLIVADI